MEQSPAPWRVFDAPASAGNGEPGQAAASAATAQASSAAVTNQRLAIAGVLGAVAIGALAVVIAIAGGGSETIEGPGLAAGAVESDGPGSAVGEIVVDVAGAVLEPGVYRLAIGSRVGDAIAAAGGFSPLVDVERVGTELNLAAMLSDGAQIRVPSRDDAEPGGGSGGGSGGSGGSGGGGGSGSQVVNLNTASQSELETLPGIGPVTAGKIIESRAGTPFTKVEELRERGLVGEKTFESIRALVSVG